MAPTRTHKQQNKKKKKGRLPFCQKLAMEPTYTQKQQNKRKKKRKGELGFPCNQKNSGR